MSRLYCVRSVTRVRDAVFTLICLMILVPLLVLATVVAGFSPPHWSGIPLSGVTLPFLEIRPPSGDIRPPAMDEVTDVLMTMEPNGWWLAVLPGRDGLVYIEATRLGPSLLTDLGHRFDRETVGVVYSPLAQRPRALGSGNSSNTETWWQRTDPLGTWVTLTFGFPWQLGTALLLTSIVWAFRVRRRRRRTAPESPPAGVS